MTEQELKGLYKQTFDRLHASREIDMEEKSMRKSNGRIRRKRFAAAAGLIVAMAAAGTTAVNAATDGKLVRTVTYYITEGGDSFSIWGTEPNEIYFTDGDVQYYVYTEEDVLVTEAEDMIMPEENAVTVDKAGSTAVQYFDAGN